MDTVAILVDGGFFTRRAKSLWGDRLPKEMAEILHRYCTMLLVHSENGKQVRDRLYRIFYYDCPPMERNVYHPLLKKDKSMKKEPLYAWMTEFQDELRSKRKVALRMGRLSDNGLGYTLSIDIIKKLCAGTLKFEDLTESDFHLTVQQKGVDMRIGIDIASMVYKKQVTKIILIAGDSDFVPAAKLARREGIDFVLNPLGSNINGDLREHIDGLINRGIDLDKALNPVSENKISRKQKKRRQHRQKSNRRSVRDDPPNGESTSGC